MDGEDGLSAPAASLQADSKPSAAGSGKHPTPGGMFLESLIYIASKAIPALIAFGTGMALTWLMRPADYGLYGLGLALSTLVSSAAFEWHGMSFMRFFQSNRESRTYIPTIVQVFLLLCAATGIIALVVRLTGVLSSDYQALIWISVPGAWCYAWFELSARMQVARFRPTAYLRMNLARNIGILTLGVALAWATGSPLWVLAGNYFAMAATASLFNRKAFDPRPSLFDRAIALRLWRFGWPIAIVQVMSGFSFAIDRILIGSFVDKAAVGFYTVAYALTQTTIAMIGAGIDSAIYSRAVQAADRGDPAALEEQLKRNCTLMLALLMPSAIGVAMVAPGLARLCVSPEYVGPVTSLIAWMAIGALILAFRANYVDHGFHFGHSTTRLTVMMAVMSSTNLIGDLILIPRFGAVGAVYATIIAGSVGMALGILLARSFIKLPFPKVEIAKIVAATAIMGLFLWLLRDRTGILVLAVQVAGGAVVFGACALAFDLMHVRRLAHAKLAAWRGAH